mmetsp:Transcript_3299/g.9145  ORF Transcript_3299/g.9145 Transcript_3299/m.9145 type:complete len:247 (+) Transcript_3299:1523-2263(+)
MASTLAKRFSLISDSDRGSSGFLLLLLFFLLLFLLSSLLLWGGLFLGCLVRRESGLESQQLLDVRSKTFLVHSIGLHPTNFVSLGGNLLVQFLERWFVVVFVFELCLECKQLLDVWCQRRLVDSIGLQLTNLISLDLDFVFEVRRSRGRKQSPVVVVVVVDLLPCHNGSSNRRRGSRQFRCRCRCPSRCRCVVSDQRRTNECVDGTVSCSGRCPKQQHSCEEICCSHAILFQTDFRPLSANESINQ